MVPARALPKSASDRAGDSAELWPLRQQRRKLSVREGGKVLASQDVTLKERRQSADGNLVFNCGEKRTQDARNRRGARRRRRESAEQHGHPTGQRGRRASRASCISRASRAGSTSSSAARWTITQRHRARQHAAHHAEQDPYAIRASTAKRVWRTVSRPRPRSCSAYQGLIIGGVEANYFTPAQQQLIRDFVDRRGGGLLFIGGRATLSRRRLCRTRRWPIWFRRSCPPRAARSIAIFRRVGADDGRRAEHDLPPGR